MYFELEIQFTLSNLVLENHLLPGWKNPHTPFFKPIKDKTCSV